MTKLCQVCGEPAFFDNQWNDADGTSGRQLLCIAHKGRLETNHMMVNTAILRTFTEGELLKNFYGEDK